MYASVYNANEQAMKTETVDRSVSVTTNGPMGAFQ